MKLIAYTILDQKTKIYAKPFMAANDDEAIRMLSTAISHGDSNLATHPEDFVLFSCGEFDDDKGELTTFNQQIVTRLSDIQLPTNTNKETQQQILTLQEAHDKVWEELARINPSIDQLREAMYLNEQNEV